MGRLNDRLRKIEEATKVTDYNFTFRIASEDEDPIPEGEGVTVIRIGGDSPSVKSGREPDRD